MHKHFLYHNFRFVNELKFYLKLRYFCPRKTSLIKELLEYRLGVYLKARFATRIYDSVMYKKYACVLIIFFTLRAQSAHFAHAQIKRHAINQALYMWYKKIVFDTRVRKGFYPRVAFSPSLRSGANVPTRIKSLFKTNMKIPSQNPNGLR